MIAGRANERANERVVGEHGIEKSGRKLRIDYNDNQIIMVIIIIILLRMVSQSLAMSSPLFCHLSFVVALLAIVASSWVSTYICV